MRNKLIILISLLILGLPAGRILLTSSFFEPHDLHHLADIYQMYRSLESGQFPPRWGPDFSFTYGYPLFNFYYLLLLIIFSTIVIIFSLILVKIYSGFYSNLALEIFLFIIMIFLKNSINIFFVKLINKIG